MVILLRKFKTLEFFPEDPDTPTEIAVLLFDKLLQENLNLHLSQIELPIYKLK